jgi:iron complex outermembrane receptor protein
VAANWEVDAALRRVGALPNPAVPAYSELDLRVGWRPTRRVELAFGGNNLLHARHPEFGTVATRSLIERSLYVRLTWSH